MKRLNYYDLAKQIIDKIDFYEKRGWLLYNIDLIDEYLFFDKKIKVLNRGKIKLKRKIKKIKLSKEEIEKLEELSVFCSLAINK